MPDARHAARAGSARPTRTAQVESLLARVLRERLARGLNDPRVQGMVSVTGVDLSGDMANATVRVTVLPADRERLTLSGLRSATRHLEALVRKATRLRRVPKLSFEIDERLKRESAVRTAIQSIASDQSSDSRATQPEVIPDPDHPEPHRAPRG